MDVSTVGIATTWAETRAATTLQAIEIAMLRQQEQADRSLVQLLDQAVEAGKTPAAAPAGQGQHIDIQA
jgi:hypothetical protein